VTAGADEYCGTTSSGPLAIPVNRVVKLSRYRLTDVCQFAMLPCAPSLWGSDGHRTDKRREFISLLGGATIAATYLQALTGVRWCLGSTKGEPHGLLEEESGALLRAAQIVSRPLSVKLPDYACVCSSPVAPGSAGRLYVRVPNGTMTSRSPSSTATGLWLWKRGLPSCANSIHLNEEGRHPDR
jgi:hypothetical protein